MLNERIKKLEELIKEGESFNYNNFSLKGNYGYPSSFKAEYIEWITKVEHILFSFFGRSSSIFESFKKTDKVTLIGNGSGRFNLSQSIILGTLRAAIEVIKFEPKEMKNKNIALNKDSKVFIVHGHDEKMKSQLEIFLHEIGLTAIVLHRKPDEGMTIIEKFEKYSTDASYAFILLTPDDVFYPVLKNDIANSEKKEMRARQNVIFEFGYFVGKLGRKRVCCLYKKGISIPTDISGMLYKEISDNVEEVALAIIKDLKASGYKVDV